MAELKSKKPLPAFNGRVGLNGKLDLDSAQQQQLKAHMKSLAGQRVTMTIGPYRDTRSDRANRFYWSCVLGVMSKESSDGDQSPEEIHDAMCDMFLPDERKRIEFVNHMTGEVLTVEPDARRSSKLKGDEFYDFVEKVRKFALEFMGVKTEDPDPEYWRKRVAA